jgi:hypothetical protein
LITQRTDSSALSQAERIVFAAEGLFLAHDFPLYWGIRVESGLKSPALHPESIRHPLIVP